MFTPGITVDQINQLGKKCMVGHLGIEITEIGEDFIRAKMPVDERTKQPLGLLHGGASVSLAETLGSIAASFSVDPSKQYCVGLDINANHIRSVKSGFVYGTAKPLHLGRSTQVWEIKITNEEDKLVCISRITLAIMDIRN
ncbi:MAG: hotdog fold thioesterase [Bacteroidetes bacterium]|nr:hotdog fold thioesterase [Bacteroidota bacterium]MDA1120296.1 hotdog fold thioesterase [Bacteroidota bacterium]